MFVDSVYRLDIPAGFDIMPEFKVCIKGDGRGGMTGNIMPSIFIHHHVIVFRAGLLKEFFNPIFKPRGIVLITSDKERGYRYFSHSLGIMNIELTTPGSKNLQSFPAWIKLLFPGEAGI